MKQENRLNQIKNSIAPLDASAMASAREHQNKLIKPLGSLGTLEDISVQFAGITGKVKNRIDKKIHILFGADNGICAEGVSSAPQEFTNWLISCYGAGRNAGINVLCKTHGIDLKLVDMGVKGNLDYSGIDNRRLMEGTNNFAKEPAIPFDTVLKAVEIGISYGDFASEQGYDIIGTGEVGIGNTTTAAACIMAALGITEPDLAVGRGAGLTDESFAGKKQIILSALNKHKPDKNNPLDIISKVGGLDIAALTGLYLSAAFHKIPIVIDGVISIAAALLAVGLNPNVKGYLFPSHLSEEPGYALAADFLGLKPYLSLNMRLGEGTGCPLAIGVITDALAIMSDMDTFDDLSLDSEFRV